MKIPISSTLALSATLACTVTINPQDTTTGAPDTTTSGTDTGDTTTTTAVPTTSGTTTGATTSATEPAWCNGFDPNGALALALRNGDNEPIAASGSKLTLECGGQGSLMFPIYPDFGGFVPDDGETVSFSVTLDVEGFDVGPDGHFFANGGYHFAVECSYDTYGYDGYANPFIAMFPPAAVADITAVNGKPGVLHVTLHTPGEDIEFTAEVTMQASEDDFGYCGGYMGGTDTDPDTGTSTGADTGSDTGTTG